MTSRSLVNDTDVAQNLLATLGVEIDAVEPWSVAQMTPTEGWKMSGASALTACNSAPPGDIAACMRGAALALRVLSTQLGNEVIIDGPALLSERERLCRTSHHPVPGMTLRGGGRMLESADGWLAVNLPRDADWDLIPALTMGLVQSHDTEALAHWGAQQRGQWVVQQAALLGLAVGAISPLKATQASNGPYMFQNTEPKHRTLPTMQSLTVMDLSRLWAGPLAGALLASAGASVTKIESLAQPEKVLPEDAAFAHRLNGNKERLRVDFNHPTALDKALAQADVVIVSARQRAFTSLGLHQRPHQLWISISAHGGSEDPNQRVGYGDDAAAEAGAVCWEDGVPHFAGDALADPVTGLLAAVTALGLLANGRTGLLRLDLAGAVRWAIDPHRRRR
jgi:hypothetical protein